MVESDPKETTHSRERWRSLAVALMLVAALFSGVVMGIMIATHVSEPPTPPDSPTLQSLRALLVKNPGSEELKDALRQEDQRARQGFFTHRKRLAAGAWMLLVGLAATVICARWYAALDKKSPSPSTPAERADAVRWLAERRRRLIALGAAGAVLLAVVFAFALAGGLATPAGVAGPPAVAGPAPAPTGGAEHAVPRPDATVSFKDNWPRFRGPDGTGVVKADDWPADWDAATGKNVLWRSQVPTPGNGSPLLWAGRVFLTGATADRQDVMCFDRTSGKLLWRTPVTAPRGDVTPGDIKVIPETGYAASTPATDGERVYVTYASSDVAAVDFDGKLVWARNLGKPESAYGRATSLLVYQDKVIVQFDRGTEPEDSLSSMLALDAKSGQTVWSTPRPVRNCWCTPILVTVGDRTELVANGSPWVMGYDPQSGKELWRCGGMKLDVASSPTFAGGLVFVTNDGAKVLAIRPGGTGDVTATNVVWSAEDGMSDAASPVADDAFFLQVTSSGRVTCYDAKAGKLLWDHVLPGSLWASPTIAGKRVYLPGEDGKVYILDLADKFSLAATCDLGEPLRATPAFGDGHIYFRGKDSLFCIGPAGSK